MGQWKLWKKNTSKTVEQKFIKNSNIIRDYFECLAVTTTNDEKF